MTITRSTDISAFAARLSPHVCCLRTCFAILMCGLCTFPPAHTDNSAHGHSTDPELMFSTVHFVTLVCVLDIVSKHSAICINAWRNSALLRFDSQKCRQTNRPAAGSFEPTLSSSRMQYLNYATRSTPKCAYSKCRSGNLDFVNGGSCMHDLSKNLKNFPSSGGHNTIPYCLKN